MHQMRGLGLFVAGLCAIAAGVQSQPLVATSLKTDWPAPPAILEAVEFISLGQPEAAFSYLSHLSSSGLLIRSPQLPARHLYAAILGSLNSTGITSNNSSAAFLPNEHLLPLLKLALSTRNFAPRVQAHYRLYAEEVEPRFMIDKPGAFDETCDAWVDWHGSQACDPAALTKLMQQGSKSESAAKQQIHSFDHVHQLSERNDAPLAILYADVSSPNFSPLHDTLLRLSAEDKITYVLRYKPPRVAGPSLTVSGYGVELALKSTEYKVVDDREVQKAETSGQKVHGRKQTDENDLLKETPSRIVPLNKNETTGIGMKTAQLVLKSANPMNSLVDITQNFPKFAHLLKDVVTEGDIAVAIEANQRKMPGMRNRLWINGLEQELANYDIFSLQRFLRTETTRVASLMALGLTSEQAIDMLTTPLADKSALGVGWGEAFDVRTELAVWWNDLAKDSRYLTWPSGVTSIARQPMGQLKTVRVNLMQVLFLLDLTDPAHLSVLAQAFQFIDRKIPLRFGLVPLVDEVDPYAPASLAGVAFYHIRKTRNLKDAKAFISELFQAAMEGLVDGAAVQAAYGRVTGSAFKSSLDAWSPQRDEFFALLADFSSRHGIDRSVGAIFANGKHLDITQDWPQNMLAVYGPMMEYLDRQIYEGTVTDETEIYDHFLTLPNAYPSRDPLVFGAPTLFDFLDCAACQVVDRLTWWHADAAPSSISMLVVADFETEDGAALLLDAAEYAKTAEGVRLTLLHNGNAPFNTMPHTAGSDDDQVSQVLEILTAHKSLQTEILALLKALSVKPEQRAIIVNGRVLPLAPRVSDTRPAPFSLLAKVEFQERISGVAKKVAEIFGEPDGSVAQRDRISSVILKCSSSLASAAGSSASDAFGRAPKPRLPNTAFAVLDTTAEAAIVTGKNTSAIVRIVAIVDPLTEAAQKLAAMLRVLSRVEGTSVTVFLNPGRVDGDGVPIKRFYRYALSAEPQFDSDGALELPGVEFHGLPLEPLYTLGMDVPNAWIVFPEKSIHDLDNIRLAKLQGSSGVTAEFLLQNILVEGHARETRTGSPPRGLQFLLGTPQNPARLDTITMANLGYLQLKANPGVWSLRLREGRSAEIYDLLSVAEALGKEPERLEGQPLAESVPVVVDSFEGVTVYPIVAKKRGMEMADVLSDETQDAGTRSGPGAIWHRMKSSLFGTTKVAEPETINVFSVASGHLYERFLSIMMLSVIKNTKSPVKFWFIENFLSPSFKVFLPHLADAYGFKYELVTYKWPHWLRQQTEKQRTIWGYKILFLDVLFPLDLSKVIFVDADQVVRTDLRELVDMDLEGAVYGYTPFCDDRHEMDGFRFWKHGYWKDHLAGKPYHISALYVVDLRRFRQLAAGDRLRQQYQMLSADPNSLANLDQDLPNNMNTPHQIPIFSLPQEWLWCETWCSDQSLKTAKTIDLCNNPLTKEPKLERAKRILPEWVGLDDEVAAVAARVASDARSQTSTTASASVAPHDRDEL
ncbi:hypothetical protein HDU87_006558 [Geranomyces variabilis]|uniref:UDP-glucose:glycoprotein glucosyltransferase n=1 Tax=Geranomyces variabilis TaxID=109894 RepID=A0AAD5XQG7_9FUNG|nr:hypothetical protein HDU87_006558 [Geranomyces variabilis]